MTLDKPANDTFPDTIPTHKVKELMEETAYNTLSNCVHMMSVEGEKFKDCLEKFEKCLKEMKDE